MESESKLDLCVAVGGDGTVSSVAAGLVNTQVPIGIVPSGTGNALAQRNSRFQCNHNQRWT
ncbi:MAG: acylglycerol kinase family protein [Anaerolineae bacterium]|nr:acylglycerol kinase family protein [Anaerolineae bacterium]